MENEETCENISIHYEIIKSKYEEHLVVFLQKKLTNTSPTIISNNYIGGVISHDLILRFNSPMVNLFIKPSDFIFMCENLEDFMERAQNFRKRHIRLDIKNI